MPDDIREPPGYAIKPLFKDRKDLLIEKKEETRKSLPTATNPKTSN